MISNNVSVKLVVYILIRSSDKGFSVKLCMHAIVLSIIRYAMIWTHTKTIILPKLAMNPFPFFLIWDIEYISLSVQFCVQCPHFKRLSLMRPYLKLIRMKDKLNSMNCYPILQLTTQYTYSKIITCINVNYHQWSPATIT